MKKEEQEGSELEDWALPAPFGRRLIRGKK